MSIRTRTLSATLLVALLPLLVLGVWTRREAGRRLVEDYETRVDVLVDAVVRRVDGMDRALSERLDALRLEAEVDQSLMLALHGVGDDDAYPGHFALTSRNLAGLDRLLILDESGAAAARSPEGAAAGVDGLRLVDALRTTPGRLGLLAVDDALVLARVDSCDLGGRRHYLVAGFDLDRDDLIDLAGGGPVGLSLVTPLGAVTTEDDLSAPLERAGRDRLSSPEYLVPADSYLTRAVGFPVVAGMGAGPRRTPVPLVPATLLLTHSLAERDARLRSLDTLLAGLAATTLLVSVIVAWILSQRLTRPLRRLSRDAEALDLDRLDTAFPYGGRDEVGRLAHVLEAMRGRLLSGVEKLRQAEGRAVMGDLARQVNHDVRNGFLPIRNVVRHLEDVARDDPDALPEVFAERAGTLDAGLKYLENLAGSWRRLASSPAPAPLDPAAVVDEALAGFPDHVTIEAPATPLPRIVVDPTALRRMVQNLVRNALQSLDDDGRVTVTPAVEDGPETTVTITVADTGRGIDEATLARIFEPFYTTRADGSGLGLAIVRRLAADAGGDVRAASTPGVGSVFTLVFPVRSDGGKQP